MTETAAVDQALALDRRDGPAGILARAVPALGLVFFSFVVAVRSPLTARSLLPLLAVAVVVVLYYCRVPLGGIRAVPFTAALALLVAGVDGGLAAAVVPAAILIAVTWSDSDHRRVRPERDSMLAIAAAVVLGFLLSGLMLGPLSSGGTGDGGTVEREQVIRREPTAGSSFVERLLARIAGFLTGGDDSATGELGQGAPVRPPDPDPMDWRQLLISLVVLAVIVALLMLLWRLIRRRLAERHDGAGVVDLVRRYDKIGARTLRERRPSEGVAYYGAVVSRESGDERIAGTGDLISDVLYNPEAPTGRHADAALGNLESDPPPSARRSWWRRGPRHRLD